MTKQIFPACTAFLFLILMVGCGPTRKEYAINEALLIDQTRMLEDQLYRAHFEIQNLQDENARLRRRLGEPEKAKASPVPFEQKPSKPAEEQGKGGLPNGTVESPEYPQPGIDGFNFDQPSTQFPPAQPSTQYPPGANRYRVAQRGAVRRPAAIRTAAPYYPAQSGQARAR